MKSDFLVAVTQLSAEKNLPKEVVISAVEAALVSAYRKDNFAPNQNISVKINPTTGKVEVWAEKTIVEVPKDNRSEVSLDEAHRVKPGAQIGEIIEVEATPHNAGRIAAQTAKQVILQRLHEAEHTAIFDEYSGKEGDIVVGTVQRIEPKQILIELGRAEAVMPLMEQIRSERYRIGQRLKVYLLEVARTSKGPQLVVSRSHPDLIRRLFETEIPEIFSGTVELKSIAREAGYRSKVAVATRQEGIDPVGCCVGLRGIRIQNIVSELNGEKIDVVTWNPDPAVFIANALSPAQIVGVKLNKDEGAATVVVPDKQLSLAIGKEGQNVRLAAKLTGFRIDIKTASATEAERAEAELLARKEEEATASKEEAIASEELLPETPAIPEPELVSVEPEEEAESLPVPEPAAIPAPTRIKPRIRFAEELITPVPVPTKPQAKSGKRKKKGARDKESAEDGIKLKRTRRVREISEDADDEF